MTRILVSHSKLDSDIVNFFTAAFATSKGVNADFMEFEDLEGKNAGREIAGRIKNPDTQAVFVLLGPGVRNALHTENWVTFEVGVACGIGRDVWVFEPFDNIKFPIPYLNHYVLYQIGNKEDLQFTREMIGAYSLGLLFRDNAIRKHKPPNFRCTHCLAEYWLHTRTTQFRCPCCGTTMMHPGFRAQPAR